MIFTGGKKHETNPVSLNPDVFSGFAILFSQDLVTTSYLIPDLTILRGVTTSKFQLPTAGV